jgi:hypothetical protein
MKKSLLTAVFAFSLFFSFQMKASHLMGGQITGRQITGLQYEITLTLYRDSLGIPIGNPEQLRYYDNASTLIATHSVLHDPGVMLGNGVELYVYRDTMDFPAPGNYTVNYLNCCRNASILNIIMPASTSMALRLKIEVGNNSSPEFLNNPIPFAQINQPYVYNPLPFDADGDSLAWELVTPSDDDTSAAFGYSHPFATVSDPFSMDSLTGEISFTPNTLGNFVAAAICYEYRNGLQIGFIRREMQIIVIPSGNVPAAPAFMANFSGPNNTSFTIPAGQNLQFDFDVTDSDAHGQSLNAMGEPFLLTNNPAVFTATNGIGAANLNVTWAPNASQARSLPYLMNIRRTEHLGMFNLSNDMTFRLFVESTPTSIKTAQKTAIQIFPNPVSDVVYISYQASEKSNLTIEIIETGSGKLVVSRNVSAIAGVNISTINIAAIANGNYLVRIASDNTVLESKLISIAH